MTLSRGQSLKVQSPNQFKLKSNFNSKNNAIIQYKQSAELPIDSIEKTTNGNILYKQRTIAEQNLCGSEKNSDALNYGKGSMSPGEHQIQSTDMLSLAPNIETNNKNIRLTIAPMHVNSRRTNIACYNKLRRSTTQPILRSWFNWFHPKKNVAFYSPPSEHPTNGLKINIHTNDNPNGVHTVVNVHSMSLNDDEEISNSSLQNVDELASYMDEIRAREKR